MTYLQDVVVALSLQTAFDRLKLRTAEIYLGMPVLEAWAAGALHATRLGGVVSGPEIDQLRAVLYSVVTARLEADGLRSVVENRLAASDGVSPFDMALAEAASELADFDRLCVMILALPAFYKTGGTFGVSWLYVLQQGDTIEGVASRFLHGQDNGAEAILLETPEFDPNTELTDAAIGAQIRIPYDAVPPNDLMDNSWVFDAQTGLRALGQGLSNDFATEVVGDVRTLKVIREVENYAQCIINRVLVPQGSVDGFETFGCRALALVGVAPPDQLGAWAAHEVESAALADPRTAAVLKTSITRDGDATLIELVVRTIHQDSGTRVTVPFTIPAA